MPEPLATPRALLVTRNFPPLVGGMERVNLELLQSLASHWRVSLSGPGGAAAAATAAAAVYESPLRPLPLFVLRNAWGAWRLARRERPALVIAGSGLAAPMAWLAARSCGARLAVYLHGLDLIAPSRVYQYCWLPFIRACDLALVNSRNTGRLAEARGLDPGRIAVLNPGTTLPELDPAAGQEFRARLGLGEAPLLLSVGRFTRRKGLAEFVALALPKVVAARPEARLLVIGGEASDALHGAGGGERERIQAAADAAGVGRHLHFLGRCAEPELRAAYQAADCHVFPVLDLPGDVEGFGMVALEAAAHGLSTVAFAVGGVPEALSEGVSGYALAPGDYSGMAGRILELLGRSPAERAEDAVGSRQFAAGFEWPRFGSRLREIVAGLLAGAPRPNEVAR